MDRQRRTRNARRGGFTILELLLVVVMVSLLGAISMGKMSRILTSWRVNRAAQAMSEELQKAFALVGRNRKPVIVQFNKSKMVLSIRGRTDTVYTQRSFGMESEYTLDSADVKLSTAKLEIYPPGLAADSLSIRISKNGAYRRVRMLRGGLVQICTSSNPNQC